MSVASGFWFTSAVAAFWLDGTITGNDTYLRDCTICNQKREYLHVMLSSLSRVCGLNMRVAPIFFPSSSLVCWCIAQQAICRHTPRPPSPSLSSRPWPAKRSTRLRPSPWPPPSPLLFFGPWRAGCNYFDRLPNASRALDA